MANKRKVEVFSAGCLVCEETVSLVRRIAKQLDVHAVPAVVVDRELAACCVEVGPTESALALGRRAEFDFVRRGRRAQAF